MHPLLEIDGCKCTRCTRAAVAPEVYKCSMSDKLKAWQKVICRVEISFVEQLGLYLKRSYVSFSRQVVKGGKRYYLN